MSIRDRVVKCWCVLNHPKWWFNGDNYVLLSKIKGLGTNDLNTEKSVIKKCDIKIIGRNNDIKLNRCELFNCNIFMRGEGHRLVIENGESTVGSGQIVCGGKGISIHIGKECMFADGVDIWSTDTHSVLQEGVLVNEPESITIGDHVWLGKDVAVLKGVTIGDNAVVGMRSLVTNDIRPGTLNVGSPAKEIRGGIEWTRENPNN